MGINNIEFQYNLIIYNKLFANATVRALEREKEREREQGVSFRFLKCKLIFKMLVYVIGNISSLINERDLWCSVLGCHTY